MSRNVIVLALCFLVLSACATAPAPYPDPAQDPIEKFNRGVYRFNEVFDKVTLKPVAKAYTYLPKPLRTGVGNFFANLSEPVYLFNNLMQGKPGKAASSLGRLLINSTLGLGGLLDPAGQMGLERAEEDFGQTLAVWGVPPGPYILMPVLGPTTLRDGPARFVDGPGNILYHFDEASVRDKLIALSAIDGRAGFLDLEDTLKGALDPYVLMREGWLQRRNYVVFDGDPPVKEFPGEEEWGDDDEDWDIEPTPPDD